jgi:hypothetical protein
MKIMKIEPPITNDIELLTGAGFIRRSNGGTIVILNQLSRYRITSGRARSRALSICGSCCVVFADVSQSK